MTCVSTGRPGNRNHTERTTLPVLRPTPGNVTKSSSSVGTSPPKRSSKACAIPMMLFVFERKKPVDWMTVSTSEGSACARSAAVGYFANNAGVTMLTRSSVVCADRIVATRSWNAFSCASAQRASGYSSRSRRTTSPARYEHHGRVTAHGSFASLTRPAARAAHSSARFREYPRQVPAPTVTTVTPAGFASIEARVRALDDRSCTAAPDTKRSETRCGATSPTPDPTLQAYSPATSCTRTSRAQRQLLAAALGRRPRDPTRRSRRRCRSRRSTARPARCRARRRADGRLGVRA